MNQHDFPANTIIFRPGDPGKLAYRIHQGTVELLRGPADRLTRLVQLGPGDVFGEMSLIEERPHALTARTVTTVETSALSRDEFERMLTEDPALFRLYLKALFERLRALSAQTEEVLEAEAVEIEQVPLAQNAISVTLHPLTRRAAETLPDAGLLVLKFPFRIGRATAEGERESLDLNDLWLLDREPFNIARNHCVIDLRGDDVVIRDRGSSQGMYVNELRIGGHMERRQADLLEGDNVVILGGGTSPYQFRINVARG